MILGCVQCALLRCLWASRDTMLIHTGITGSQEIEACTACETRLLGLGINVCIPYKENTELGARQTDISGLAHGCILFANGGPCCSHERGGGEVYRIQCWKAGFRDRRRRSQLQPRCQARAWIERCWRCLHSGARLRIHSSPHVASHTTHCHQYAAGK